MQAAPLDGFFPFPAHHQADTGKEGQGMTTDLSETPTLVGVIAPLGDAFLPWLDELLSAVDAERVHLASAHNVLFLGAPFHGDEFIDHTTAHRAVTHGRMRAAVIKVGAVSCFHRGLT